jgi:hypothetical protein
MMDKHSNTALCGLWREGILCDGIMGHDDDDHTPKVYGDPMLSKWNDSKVATCVPSSIDRLPCYPLAYDRSTGRYFYTCYDVVEYVCKNPGAMISIDRGKSSGHGSHVLLPTNTDGKRAMIMTTPRLTRATEPT